METTGYSSKVKEIVVPFMKELHNKLPESKVVISVFFRGEDPTKDTEQGVSVACEVFADVGPEHLEYLMGSALKSVQTSGPAEKVLYEKKE